MHLPAKRSAVLALAIGLATLSAPAMAAPLPSGWTADARAGCKVWNPEPEPGETVTWSGSCQDGLASGPGVTEWSENGLVTEHTEGARVGGHLQGQGSQVLGNGDRFEGQWTGDRRNGRGSYIAADGTSYVGDFKDDQFDGVGTFTDAKGNKYVGGWKAGRRNGPGTATFADGTSFTGVWIDDVPAGGPGELL